jgi:hypothetical protein
MTRNLIFLSLIILSLLEGIIPGLDIIVILLLGIIFQTVDCLLPFPSLPVSSYWHRPGPDIPLSMRGVRIVEIRDPTSIIPGAFSTGRIEQVTEYERIPPVFVARKGDQFVQEEFIGEQAIVLNAKRKGLVVLSGCARRGIVRAS